MAASKAKLTCPQLVPQADPRTRRPRNLREAAAGLSGSATAFSHDQDPLCADCSIKRRCTTGKERRIKRWEHEAVIEAQGRSTR
jgi:hypothetical protein